MNLSFSDADIGRFMGMVDILPSGCWYWMGARSRGKGNRKYYGSFRLGRRAVRAHTFAFHAIGRQPELPPGWHRDHTCRFSMCVNPEHLEAVSPEENQRRKLSGHLTAGDSAGSRRAIAVRRE